MSLRAGLLTSCRRQGTCARTRLQLCDSGKVLYVLMMLAGMARYHASVTAGTVPKLSLLDLNILIYGLHRPMCWPSITSDCNYLVHKAYQIESSQLLICLPIQSQKTKSVRSPPPPSGYSSGDIVLQVRAYISPSGCLSEPL